MIDCRAGSAAPPHPRKGTWLGPEPLAAILATATVGLAAYCTRSFLLVDHSSRLAGHRATGVGFELAAELATRHLVAALFMGVLGLLAAFFAFVLLLRRVFPIPDRIRAGAEAEAASPALYRTDRLAAALGPDRAPLAAWVVDFPGWSRPTGLVATSLLLLTALQCAMFMGYAALAAAGSLWIERYVLAGAFGMPLAALLVVLLNPGDPWLVAGGAALAAFGPWSLFEVIPTASAALGADPLARIGLAIPAVAFLWLLFRALTRPLRLLVLTPQGLLLVRVSGASVLVEAGPRRPAWLSTPRGAGGRRFRFGGDGAVPWDVEPIADDPAALRQAAAGAGLTLAEPPPGEAGAHPAEVPSPGIVVPALLVAALYPAVIPLVRLGFYLGLGVIPMIEPSMQGVDGARKMIAVCDATSARFPDDLISRAFRAIMRYDLGEYEAAATEVAIAKALGATLRYPALANGQTQQLLAHVGLYIAGDHTERPSGPATGWEPPGPVVASFRTAAWRAFATRELLWLRSSRGTLDGLGRLALEEPVAAGPRVLLAMHLVFRDGPEELARVLGLPPGPDGPAKPLDEHLVHLARVKAAVRKLLEPIDALPGWAGTSALLGSLVPGGMARARELDTGLAEDQRTAPRMAALAAALPEFAGARWVGTAEVGKPPAGWRTLLGKPPADLAALVAAWPELAEPVEPGEGTLAARLEAASRSTGPEAPALLLGK